MCVLGTLGSSSVQALFGYVNIQVVKCVLNYLCFVAHQADIISILEFETLFSWRRCIGLSAKPWKAFISVKGSGDLEQR